MNEDNIGNEELMRPNAVSSELEGIENDYIDVEIPEKEDSNRNPDGTFKKGVSGNPKGKSVGTKDFTTLYKEAIKKIAEGGDKTSEEVEIDLVASGLIKAIKGNPIFWTYIQDRIHGKPISTVRNEFPDEVSEVKINIIKNDNRNTGDNTTGETK